MNSTEPTSFGKDRIMQLMHQGKTTVEIAKIENMTPQAVHDHVVQCWKRDKASR